MGRHEASLIKQCLGSGVGTAGYVGQHRWEENMPDSRIARFGHRILEYRDGRRVVIELSYCHIHDRAEEARPGETWTCFECGHVYKSEEDIAEEFIDQIKKGMHTNVNISDVPRLAASFCPLCLHDW